MKFTYPLTLFIFLLFFSACRTTAVVSTADKVMEMGTYIRVQKSGCLMQCEISDLVLNELGQLYFHKISNNQDRTTKNLVLKKRLNKNFWATLNQQKFSNLKDYYQIANDTQSITISYVVHGVVIKKTSYSSGQPKMLTDLDLQLQTFIP